MIIQIFGLISHFNLEGMDRVEYSRAYYILKSKYLNLFHLRQK